MFLRAREEAVAAVQPRPRLEQAAPAGVPLGGRIGVPEQELEAARRDRRSPIRPPGTTRRARACRASRAGGRSASSWIVSDSAAPRAEPPHEPSGERTSSVPPSRFGSARSRNATATRSSSDDRAAWGAARRVRSTLLIAHRALAGHEGRLVVERDALQPEPERLPVDQRRSTCAGISG